jgi:predicted helicase
MQGVSINIFVKTGQKKKNELGELHHFDLQGRREFKYEYLIQNSFYSLDWELLKTKFPNFFFVKKNLDSQNQYEKHISINELFLKSTVGVSTFNDSLTVKYNRDELIDTINFIKNNSDLDFIRATLDVKKDSRDWRLSCARKDLLKYTSFENVDKVFYRPFDWRYTLHTNKSKGFIAYPRPLLVNNLLKKENYCFNTVRQSLEADRSYSFITTDVICRDSITSKSYGAPLYLYNENNLSIGSAKLEERIPNLNLEIVNQIAENLELTFTNEKETTENTFAPIDILDYIYAVLHSPTYREKYKEFLKIDFPRVPYPKDAPTFWQLVKLGGEIRQIHLLESQKVEQYITTYPIGGSNEVTRSLTSKDIGFELTDEANKIGRVWINDEQYFDKVPLVAWEFYIGGYQPAQKWLKDRKNRKLELDDIWHYQKIIVALTETDRLMREVDEVNFVID